MTLDRTPQARLIVVPTGARWPAWTVEYRSLRAADAVVAQQASEDGSAFAARVGRTARDLERLGLEIGRALVSAGSVFLQSKDLQPLTSAIASSLKACVLEVTVPAALSKQERRTLAKLEQALSARGARLRVTSIGSFHLRQTERAFPANSGELGAAPTL
jgi:hypothetical protein